MRALISSIAMSGMVAGLLVVGPAALAQNHGSAGRPGGFANHGGVSRRGFSGSITGFPGQNTTPSSHAIPTPGRSVFPTSGHAFVPGFVPQSRSAFQPSWNHRGQWHGGSSGHDRDYGRDRDHDRGRGRGYGFFAGYPFYSSSWQLLPYDLGDSDYTGDETDQSPAESEVPPPPPDTGVRPEYEGQPYSAAPTYESASSVPVPAAPIAPEPELTLIYKDGHRQTIHNYVLTHNNLIVLDEAGSGRQPRIPLDQLDLPATAQAAQQAGVDFSPPT